MPSRFAVMASILAVSLSRSMVRWSIEMRTCRASFFGFRHGLGLSFFGSGFGAGGVSFSTAKVVWSTCQPG